MGLKMHLEISLIADKHGFKRCFVMTTVFFARYYDRFIYIKSYLRTKKLHRANQCSNLLDCSFSNRDNIRAPI